jgi:C-terminal processing protease CtpA/Prc
VRSFGANSAGFLSGNIVLPLPDGAHLAITEVLVQDRTGKDYSETIQPDVPAADAEQAARGWIARQCGRK